MKPTNLGDIQHGLITGHGVFAGENADAYFLQPDGSVLDLQGQLIRPASAAGKAIYDDYDRFDVDTFKAAALEATSLEANALTATAATITTDTVTTGNITTGNITTANITTANADAANVKDLRVTENLFMLEGTQKYRIALSSGTLTATAVYKIGITADAHVSVKVEDSDEVEYANDAEVLNGAELTITLTFAEGYEKDTFTVNTVAKTSPATHTVNGAAVAIVVTSKTTT